MSGIVGLWNRDGAPVTEAHLRRMNERLGHRGPDGAGQWVDGMVGLAGQLLRVTPESLSEELPFADGMGGAIVFDGRLDDRQDLIDRLPRNAGVPVSSPDSALLLASYRHLGTAFTRHLNGDFAFAIWDPLTQELILGRDIMGARTLYWAAAKDVFVFATEVKALLAHPAVPTAPDDLAIAEYFCRTFDHRHPDRTFFAGVSSVRPGHLVRVGRHGLRIERFWDFSPGRKLRCKDDREYVEGYKEHFLRSVGRRLRSSYPVAIMASGGLDSSSILCSALTLQKQSTAASPACFGVSAVASSSDADESPYQEAIEKAYGIQLVRQPLHEAVTLRDARRDLYHGEGPFIHWHDWKGIWHESHDRGARTLLSGFFGDQVLLSPQFFLDLAMGFRWGTLRRYFEDYCRFYDTLPPTQHRRNLLAACKGYALPAFLRPLYQWGKRRVMQPRPFLGLSGRFNALAARVEKQARPLRLPTGSAHARALYNFAHSRAAGIRLAMDAAWESQYHITAAYPFRDRDLVAFLMSIPGDKVFLGGIPRGIHAEAMRGILPEQIRARRDKGDFSAIARAAALGDLDSTASTLALQPLHLRYLKPREELVTDLLSLGEAVVQDTQAVRSWELQDVIWLHAWLSVFFAEPEKAVLD